MDYRDFGTWLEAEGESAEKAVEALADAGAVSRTERKRRRKDPRRSDAQTGQTARQDGNSAGYESAGNYSNAAFDAKRFLETFEDIEFVYCSQAWHRFTRSGWREIPEDELRHEIIRYIVSGRAKLDTEDVNRILLGLKFFCQLDRKEEENFDKTCWLKFEDGRLNGEPAAGWIACEDQVFNVPITARALSRGEAVPDDAVKPLTRAFFAPGKVPCKLNPAAKCEAWETFVRQVCPNDAVTLQQAFGLSLTYDRSYNVFFVIHGPAGSGKSTALNVLQKLNSGTVSQVSLARFGERFYIHPLTQNRVNLVHDMDFVFETDQNASLREAVLKSATAGESIEVERKYRESACDHLRALCVFGTNRIPRFADKSQAIQQRMKIISFPHSFRGSTGQILNLHNLLTEELEGILIWALKGLGVLLESKSCSVWESREAADEKEEIFKDGRPEILFCEECLERTEYSGWVSSLEIYQAYQEFCTKRGCRPAGMGKAIPLITECMGIERSKLVRGLDGRPFRAVRGVSLRHQTDF